MKKAYYNPSITSLDSSGMHFFRNQATCDPNILNGQQLSTAFGSGTACGDVEGLDEIEICLGGSEDLSAQLVGLIVNTVGGSQVVITSCQFFPDDCAPGVSFYECSGTGSVSGNTCIESISCENGQTITSCSNISGCVNGS